MLALVSAAIHLCNVTKGAWTSLLYVL